MTEQKKYIKNLEVNYKIIEKNRPFSASRQVFLILHGWGSSSDRWQETANLLAEKGIKVVIPDLPGFGKSQNPKKPWELEDYSDFVEKFVRFLNLEKFYLLGHSFGGAIAVKYALKNPDLVKKLFLAGASLIRKKSLKKKFFFIFSKIFKFFSYIPFFKKVFYKFIVRSDYPQTKGVMRKTYLNIIKEDLSDQLKNIKIPSIIIWGEKDNIVSLKCGKKIKSKIKNSKLIIISNGGHDLERKNPKELSGIMSELIL